MRPDVLGRLRGLALQMGQWYLRSAVQRVAWSLPLPVMLILVVVVMLLLAWYGGG